MSCLECQPWMIKNNKCEFECYDEEFDYDNWDCSCAPYCTIGMLNNSECDWPCYTRACNYDYYAPCTVIFK